MPRMMTRRTIANDVSGATAIEYALIMALMTLIILSGLSRLGGETQSQWNGVAAEVEQVHERR